jgi:hypothetical protein
MLNMDGTRSPKMHEPAVLDVTIKLVLNGNYNVNDTHKMQGVTMYVVVMAHDVQEKWLQRRTIQTAVLVWPLMQRLVVRKTLNFNTWVDYSVLKHMQCCKHVETNNDRYE